MKSSALPLHLSAMFAVSLYLAGCALPRPWPESPLYETPASNGDWQPPADKAAAMEAIAGHYAHYDVVAYEGVTPNGPLSTFVISYGFTDFTIEDGELVEKDCFCSAEYKANQDFTTTFPDAATQAIRPRTAVVKLTLENGAWRIRRPATPTLIGVEGDPDQPLDLDPQNPLINDADNDGRPGVTVFVKLFGLIEGEIYIARREVFQNDMALFADGSIRGYVIDDSEQLVIGASLALLNVPNNPRQRRDPGLNPIILIPIAADIDTCEELLALRAALFPPSPDF